MRRFISILALEIGVFCTFAYPQPDVTPFWAKSKVTVFAVSFLGDGNIPISKDQAGSITPIMPLQWTADGTNERVGYSGGSRVNVTLTLAVNPFKGGVKMDHRGGEKVDHFLGSWGFALSDLRGRLERRPATRFAGRA